MRTVKQILKSYMKPVSTGLPVTSPLPAQNVKQISPFVSIEHQGAFTIMPGQKVDYPPYPNAGFELVSLLFEGNLEYKDGFDNIGRINSQDVQWLTTGSGIIKSEKIPDDTVIEGGKFNLVKLWINLPHEFKKSKPKYQNIKDEDIPTIKGDGFELRLIAGELNQIKSPISTFTPILIVHGKIKGGKGVNIPIPDNFNASLYVTLGQLKILGDKIEARDMIWFNNDDDNIWISSISDSEFLLLAGEPIDESMVHYGNFVMTSEEEVEQAAKDHQWGKMGFLFN